MTDNAYHLIEANLSHGRADLDDPMMVDFVERLDEIDLLAQGWPGFVAQPTLPDGGHVYREPALLNVSIWESIEDLREFTYSSVHTELLDRRAAWFVQFDRPVYVLYWSPVGELPTEKEISNRFEHLREHGPTPRSFTFDQPFTVEDMLDFEAKRG
jgi:hypothetical protein